MKNILVIVGGVVVIALVILLSVWFSPLSSSSESAKNSDEKIRLVEEFWNDALNAKAIDKHLSEVPSEFYDETARCKSVSPAQEQVKDEMSLGNGENGFTSGLRQTAANISASGSTLIKVETIRVWKNEAVVSADFAQPGQGDFREKRFFFLINRNKGWKIFLDTSALTLFNPEFARSDCEEPV